MDKIIRTKAVAELLGVSRATLWRWTKAGDFPRPVKLGKNSTGWKESDVQRWIEGRNLIGGVPRQRDRA